MLSKHLFYVKQYFRDEVGMDKQEVTKCPNITVPDLKGSAVWLGSLNRK